jgi:DNA-binding MarR family transcriptional regulator
MTEADETCACSMLRRVSRAITAAYDEALKPSGLRVTQFSVVRTLSRLGPMPVTRLANEIALDRSTMGRNLDPLERRGLIELTVGEGDARERVATLTPTGEVALRAALPRWRAVQKQVAKFVPHEELQRLTRQLENSAES